MAKQRLFKRLTFVLGLAAVIGLIALLVFARSQRQSSAAGEGDASAKLVPVRVMVAATAVLTESAHLPVTLNPVKESYLSFKLGGRIRQVRVELGSAVRAGATLATLDEGDLENQIKQAKAALAVAEASLANLKAGSRPESVSISRAQLQQAEANLEVQNSNYERVKALYAEGGASQQLYEAAHASYQAALAQVKMAKEGLSLTEAGPSQEAIKVAEAQVQQARVAKEIAESQRANLVITAPFSGCVTMVKANAGEMASPGMPLIGLADLSQFHATGFVGQDLAVCLRDGQEAEVRVQTGGETVTIKGRIVAIGQAVDQTLRTYQVKILCPRDRHALRGGMMGDALVQTKVSQADHPVISREAVLEENGRRFVYVVDKGRAARREVSTGVDNGNQVEIVSGLLLGEQVVVAGQHMLTNGSPVEVK